MFLVAKLHIFFENERKKQFFFARSQFLCIFAPLLSMPTRGRRAALYIRKTFSDVCRCETRTSQTRPSQQADDNEASRRAYLYPYYI